MGAALRAYDPPLQDDVALLLTSETPVDIYSAIVSSQFDADRLDYVRRDRIMTGAQHGGFDFSWLLANLEVDEIAVSTDGEVFGKVQSLILGNKAFQAAEEYVLGLFHLYFSVYFHKTTRAAEKMLAATLERTGQLLKEGNINKTGLQEGNPVVRFLNEQSLANYLALDDFVVWSALHEMARASDGVTLSASPKFGQ